MRNEKELKKGEEKSKQKKEIKIKKNQMDSTKTKGNRRKRKKGAYKEGVGRGRGVVENREQKDWNIVFRRKVAFPVANYNEDSPLIQRTLFRVIIRLCFLAFSSCLLSRGASKRAFLFGLQFLPLRYLSRYLLLILFYLYINHNVDNAPLTCIKP